MSTYRVMIVYEVHADTISEAERKVTRYQTDLLYYQSQRQNLLPPEIVQTDKATLLISYIATPLERKNHGNRFDDET